LAFAIFVNGAKSYSALQLSRDLDCQYKTAFVVAHKIREAMTSEAHGPTASGEVEVDGAYFGGYVKPANTKGNRRDCRCIVNHNGNRRVVIIMREHGGRTLPFVFKSEDTSLCGDRANRCAGQRHSRPRQRIGTRYMRAS
jgi:hypothetical protein